MLKRSAGWVSLQTPEQFTYRASGLILFLPPQFYFLALFCTILAQMCIFYCACAKQYFRFVLFNWSSFIHTYFNHVLLCVFYNFSHILAFRLFSTLLYLLFLYFSFWCFVSSITIYYTICICSHHVFFVLFTNAKTKTKIENIYRNYQKKHCVLCIKCAKSYINVYATL